MILADMIEFMTKNLISFIPLNVQFIIPEYFFEVRKWGLGFFGMKDLYVAHYFPTIFFRNPANILNGPRKEKDHDQTDRDVDHPGKDLPGEKTVHPAMLRSDDDSIFPSVQGNCV